ncbi:MAG: hypothetical protein MO846_04535 [Candidatus Devosia symbiotica]|nr:hypothetical protein [Candidatus Devosia symbiotica]
MIGGDYHAFAAHRTRGFAGHACRGPTPATGVEGAGDGGAIRTQASPDGTDWRETGVMPGGLPAWTSNELGCTPKNVWGYLCSPAAVI